MASFLQTLLIATVIATAVVEGHYFPLSNAFNSALPTSPYYQRNYPDQYQRYAYQPLVPLGYHKNKQIPAYLPVSPVYDVEIIKPMAQLQEKKTVPLYVIPQNSLHVFPHVQKTPARFQFPNFQKQFQSAAQFADLSQFMGDPSHLPAIEIPLEEPMVIGSPESQVLAPIGFTAIFKGPLGTSYPYSIQTSVLLAPVPAGTIISDQTPVIITTIYAVPRLPAFPSSYPILADFPSNLLQGPNGQPPLPPPRPTTVLPVASSLQPRPIDSVTVPVSPSPRPDVEAKFPTSVPTPATTFQEVTVSENEVAGREPSLEGVPPSGIVSGTAPEFVREPFINSKESPYLQELREQSLRRRIVELQSELNALLRIRN